MRNMSLDHPHIKSCCCGCVHFKPLRLFDPTILNKGGMEANSCVHEPVCILYLTEDPEEQKAPVERAEKSE